MASMSRNSITISECSLHPYRQAHPPFNSWTVLEDISFSAACENCIGQAGVCRSLGNEHRSEPSAAMAGSFSNFMWVVEWLLFVH